MESLRKKSKKLRGQFESSFDDLLVKMKDLAENRFSPKTISHQNKAMEEIKKRWEETCSLDSLDEGVQGAVGGAKPKIFDSVSPQPFKADRVYSSSPVMPTLSTHGDETPVSELDVSLTNYDIKKFHDPRFQPTSFSFRFDCAPCCFTTAGCANKSGE